MNPRSTIPVNGVELCVQEFGERGDPGILLIAGAASAMDWWDTEFCERLAAGGRRVVRFDLRDTGESTTYPPGKAGYTGDDLIADAAALVEALGLAPAHLVGISFGSGIAAQVAIRHPELVGALTLLSGSPGSDGLPGPTPEVAKAFSSEIEPPDWGDEASVAAYFLDFERLLSGDIPADEERMRRIVHEFFARSKNLASADNHWAAADGGEPRERLAEITVPTLVIHGSRDPLFPPAHGEALAREIPGAQLLIVEGMGHQNPPPETWDELVPAILGLGRP